MTSSRAGRGDLGMGLHLNLLCPSHFLYTFIHTKGGVTLQASKVWCIRCWEKGHDKGDKTKTMKAGKQLGVKGNREKAECRIEKKKRWVCVCMYMCVWVCVWRALPCESALSYGAFGRPLLCLQLGRSVLLVCSSPCHPLPLAKTLSCFIINTTAAPAASAGAAAGGGNSLWRLTCRVCMW